MREQIDNKPFEKARRGYLWGSLQPYHHHHVGRNPGVYISSQASLTGNKFSPLIRWCGWLFLSPAICWGWTSRKTCLFQKLSLSTWTAHPAFWRSSFRARFTIHIHADCLGITTGLALTNLPSNSSGYNSANVCQLNYRLQTWHLRGSLSAPWMRWAERILLHLFCI